MKEHSTDNDASALIEHIEHFAQQCESVCVTCADMKEHSVKSDASAQ
jgi:hypothetical protein